MGWQYHPVLLLFFIGGFIAVGIAVFCWQYSRSHGTSYLVSSIGLLGVHDAIWAFAAAFKTASTGLEASLLFYKMEYLGSWIAPSLTLVIALAFIGWDRWLTRRVLLILASVPIVGILLIFVNPSQSMIAAPVLIQAQGILAFEHSFTPLYVLFLAWAMGLVLLSAILVGYGGLRGIIPRTPAVLGVLVFTLPLVTIALKVTGIYPPGGTGINITPAANTIALGILSVSIINYRLFELLPVGRYRAVEFMQDGYVLAGPEETILDANRTATSLLAGESDQTLIGESVHGFIPVYDAVAERSDAAIERFSSNGRTIEVRSSTVKQLDQVTGRVLLLRDVTEQHEYKQKLERTNERLNNFAGVVSHDLRNPLTVAQGRVELMDETSEHQQAAATALDRIEAIIEDVLTLARMGNSISDRKRVSLAAIAEKSWSVIDHQDATLTVESDCRFDADATRFQQLLENLFRNAIEHGGSAVTIRVGELDDESGFYVADDGTGIDAENRETVFESGQTTNPEGTGFGLAIVKEIVTAHGWDITIADSTTGGARFEISDVAIAAE